MFELADYLVGIYKVEDCTRSCTIENDDKQRVLGKVDKENFSDSLNILPTQENSSANFSINASQDKSRNVGAVEIMDHDENEESVLSKQSFRNSQNNSANLSQASSQNDSHIIETSNISQS